MGWFEEHGFGTEVWSPIAGRMVVVGSGVPGMQGQVWNSAGGYEPGGAGNAVPGMPGRVYGDDGYTLKDDTPASQTATTTASSFDQKLTDVLKKAYPTKAANPAWLAERVNYYKGRLASGDKTGAGVPGDEAYYLKRAAGWQAGGEDVAEAGDYAPGGSLYQASSGNGSIGSMLGASDVFGYTGGSLLTPFTEQFTNTRGDAPEFQGLDPLKIADYKLPSWQDLVKTDPGIDFRINKGRDQLENSATARHFLHTGQTMKDIVDYGQNAASQEYGNAAARDLGVYTTNTGNQVNSYNAAQNQNLASNAQRSAAYNTNVANDFASFLQREKQFRQNQADQYNRLSGTAALGR